MIRKIGFVLAGVLAAAITHAQQPIQMTLEECILRAVDANLGIKIAGLETQQAENNVTYAPFLPSLDATGRHTYTGTQERAAGGGVTGLNAGLSLNWRLFDGLGMFSEYQRLRERLSVSELQMRAELETLVSDVMKQYYLLISLHNQYELFKELIQLSQLRYKEAMDRAEIGSASGLDMRLAKIDLNADSSNMILQEEALRVAYIEMNRLLNQDLELNDYVSDTILLLPQLAREELELFSQENNVSVLMARAGIRISDLDYKLAQAARMPTLDLSAGYSVTASDASTATGSFRNSTGPNVGLTVGINIFNGLEARRRVKNARLDQIISDTYLDNVELSVVSQLRKLYLNYINNLHLIDFEHENADLARLNLEAAMLRYRVGDLSGIDFRIIQQQYLNAVDRKINVIYQAKISEVSLLTLAGQL